jgi:hypothetical protein
MDTSGSMMLLKSIITIIINSKKHVFVSFNLLPCDAIKRSACIHLNQKIAIE